MNWPIVVGVIATLVVVAIGSHLLLTWFDQRGWAYYRNPDAPRGGSLGLLEEIYQPSAAHVIDQKTLENSIRDQAESGDGDLPISAT
jgi:hypothetical protein